MTRDATCDPAALRNRIAQTRARYEAVVVRGSETRNSWADVEQRATADTFLAAAGAVLVLLWLLFVARRVLRAVLDAFLAVEDDAGAVAARQAKPKAATASDAETRAAALVVRRGLLPSGTDQIVRAHMAFAFFWRFAVFVACYATIAFVSASISFDDGRRSTARIHDADGEDLPDAPYWRVWVQSVSDGLGFLAGSLGLGQLARQLLGLLGLYLWAPVLSKIADALLSIEGDLDPIRTECSARARATSAVACMLAAGLSEDAAVDAVLADETLFPRGAHAAGTIAVDPTLSVEAVVGSAYANGRARALSEGRASSQAALPAPPAKSPTPPPASLADDVTPLGGVASPPSPGASDIGVLPLGVASPEPVAAGDEGDAGPSSPGAAGAGQRLRKRQPRS